MLELLSKIHRSPSDRATFARFATVGTVVAILDVLVLYFLIHHRWDPYVGRLISYSAATLFGYFLNRYFTFHHIETGRRLVHSIARHFSVHSTGGLFNLLIYALILVVGQSLGGRVAASATLPMIAVWIGGVVGLAFNFFFSKRFVFDN